MSDSNFAFDTSTVMRLLVGAPATQFRAASRFLREQVAAGTSVAVDDLVLAEAYFALQSYYSATKTQALQAIATFANHSGIEVSPHAGRILALPDLPTTKPGFVDRLIHGTANAHGLTLVTFEKAAVKLPSVHLLPS